MDNRIRKYMNLNHPVDNKIVNYDLSLWPQIASSNGFGYKNGDEGLTFWYRDLLRFLRKKAMTHRFVVFPDEIMEIKISTYEKKALDSQVDLSYRHEQKGDQNE